LHNIIFNAVATEDLDVYIANGVSLLIELATLLIWRKRKEYSAILAFLNTVVYDWAHLTLLRAAYDDHSAQFLIVLSLPFFVINKILINNLGSIFYKIGGIIAWICMTVLIKWDNKTVHLIPFLLIMLTGMFFVFFLKRRKFDLAMNSKNSMSRTVERMKALLNIYINDAVLVLDVYIREILFSNSGFHQTFGHHGDDGETNKRDLKYVLNKIEVEEEGIHNNESVYLWELIEALRENAVQEVYQTTCKYQNETGEIKMFKVKISHYTWDHTRAFVIVFSDISQQQHLKELQASGQNQELMLDIFAHELRTPIKNILGALNLISKEMHIDKESKDKPQTKYISMCHMSCKYLLSVSNTFLDVARLKHDGLKINVGAFSLSKLINEVKEMLECQVGEKGLKFEVEISSQVPDRIVSDRDKLEQIFLNILTNSIKFTVSGVVKIQIKLDSAFPDSIEITISDTGKGIRQSDRQKLFKMFSSLGNTQHMNPDGAGLGLSIAQRLTKALAENDDQRGIRVESVFGRGSKFTFSITAYRKHENFFVDFQHPMLPDEKESGDMSLTLPRSSKLIKTVRPQPKLLQKVLLPSTPQLEIPVTTAAGSYIPTDNLANPLDKTLSVMHSINPMNHSINPMTHSIHPMSTGELQSEKDDEFSVLTQPNNNPILVVDDNPMDLMLICQQLDNLKISYKTALGGEACLDAVDEAMVAGQSFRGILIDCYMPDLNGFQTAKILKARMSRKEVPDTPIIALSAHDTQDNREKAFKAGMIAWYTKPLAEEDITELLESCTKMWRFNSRKERMLLDVAPDLMNLRKFS